MKIIKLIAVFVFTINIVAQNEVVGALLALFAGGWLFFRFIEKVIEEYEGRYGA